MSTGISACGFGSKEGVKSCGGAWTQAARAAEAGGEAGWRVEVGVKGHTTSLAAISYECFLHIMSMYYW